MSEIEIGEWVRTKEGFIDKIQCDFNKNDWRSKNTYGELIVKCEYNTYLLKNILKHSKNLIDLIETDDIVILEYYVAKYKQRITRRFEVFRHDNLISFNNVHCDFLYDLDKSTFVDGRGYNVKIKKILTKEQFNQNCYEVEE